MCPQLQSTFILVLACKAQGISLVLAELEKKKNDSHAEKEFCSYFALIIVPIIPAGIAFIYDSYSETGGLFWIQSYDSDHTIVEGIFQ